MYTYHRHRHHNRAYVYGKTEIKLREREREKIVFKNENEILQHLLPTVRNFLSLSLLEKRVINYLKIRLRNVIVVVVGTMHKRIDYKR